MKKLLVIGASGFVGGHLAKVLLTEGFAVRCLARRPEPVAPLAALGCEVMAGDICDPASLARAFDGVEAAYVSVQTLSPQPAGSPGQGFMDIEKAGMRNVADACLAHGVRRLITVTSVGIARDAKSAWLRGRWEIEEMLLATRLDVTVIRPGEIVGIGGRGFGMRVSAAKSRVALVLGPGGSTMSAIALDDLIYYLRFVLDEKRAFGQRFDVGGDAMTVDARIDIVAGVLGRKPPLKLHIPAALLIAFAPLIERMAKMPKGAVKGFVDGMEADGVGDPMPIRAILPRPLLNYRQAVEAALQKSKVS